MGIPLVQQMPEVCDHVPCNSFEFFWVNFIRFQPLQVQDVLLTVSQLINMTEFHQSSLSQQKKPIKKKQIQYINLFPKISGTS